MVAEFLFSGESKYRTCIVVRVGFLELMKQGEAFSALLVVRGFAEQQVCLCFGLFCFLACCWVSGATRFVVLKDHPFDVGKILLVAA